LKITTTQWSQEQEVPKRFDPGKGQVGHFFFSLKTDRRLNRNNWTLVRMPAEVKNELTYD